jgi:hypothetical protein
LGVLPAGLVIFSETFVGGGTAFCCVAGLIIVLSADLIPGDITFGSPLAGFVEVVASGALGMIFASWTVPEWGLL